MYQWCGQAVYGDGFWRVSVVHVIQLLKLLEVVWERDVVPVLGHVWAFGHTRKRLVTVIV